MSEILEIFGVDWRLLLVQMFNFGVLLIALWYFLYRPVVVMLEKRRTIIEKGVDDAQAAKEERAQAGDDREAILTDATMEASFIMDRAKERAGGMEEDLLKTAQTRSENILKEAQAKAQEDKRQILESGKEEIARMVVLGTEKILKEQK